MYDDIACSALKEIAKTLPIISEILDEIKSDLVGRFDDGLSKSITGVETAQKEILEIVEDLEKKS